MRSFVEAETLLAVDVGSVTTRASLFDVVAGSYRLIATGSAHSTAGSPLFDIGEGVRLSLDEVQEITGRQLLDEAETLIMPVSAEGAGVDVFVATSSAGLNVRVVLVGLMPGVSLESARRLAISTYMEVVDEIGLMDRRREEEKIDLILATRPDLIMIIGGIDGGASESVMRMVEVVSTAIGLFSDAHRPRLIFAGNRHLSAAVADKLSDRASVTLAPNIRPTLDHEDLRSARTRLTEVVTEVRTTHLRGFEELRQWSNANISLTADAGGRVVRYLSQVYDPDKGVLAVDVGASHLTATAAFDGQLHVTVRSDLGLGHTIPGILRQSSLEECMRWMPVEISEAELLDYIYNKSLFPHTVPMDGEELHIEYALVRQLIREVINTAKAGWPAANKGNGLSLLPPMEPILGTGAALTNVPFPGYAALVMLDGIQPTGITTLVLDTNNLLPALGAAAGVQPVATVQILESGSFTNLGTVIAPIGKGRPGRKVLRYVLERSAGGEIFEGEAKFGELVLLRMREGEHGRLTLRPEWGFDVGFGGPRKGGTLQVSGGAAGLIIDARGRPIQFTKDISQQCELNQKWLWDMGANQ